MITFPNMSITRFVYYTLLKRIKKIRPLWYLGYSKEEARKELARLYDWEYYGGII